MNIKNLGANNVVGLEDKLKKGKQLTVKLGFDPTSPDLHLGHFIALRAAKKFQEAGHKVVLLIGDFTAAIGDPSGRNTLRPPLSEEQIKENAQTYIDQLAMVLDISKVEVRRNSEWLNKLTPQDIIRHMSKVTVAQMLVREDFSKRYKEETPIHLHEFTYPLMQALDSVFLKADVELGGTDQTFNLMMGRQIQKAEGQDEQAIITFPLLVGLDGVKKMSKSLNNHIGLSLEPNDKFGRVMSISDETMWNYMSVLLEKNDDEIMEMKSSGVNPMQIKMFMAKEIVAMFHGEEVALKAKEAFEQRFSKKDVAAEAKEMEILLEEVSIMLPHLIKKIGFAESTSDANRKIEQGGVKINGEKIVDKKTTLGKDDEFLLQVGKLNVAKIKLK